MSPLRSPIAVLFVLAALCVTAQLANAQTEPTRHTLAGHRFLPSVQVQDGFVETNLRLNLGAGRAIDLTVPVLNLDGEQIGTVSGNVGFMLIGLGYQHRFTDWFSLGADLGGAARVGTTTVALIAEGASAIYGAAFTAKARIVQKPKYLLSGTLAARSNTGYAISPLDWAREVIDEGGVDSTTSLLSSDDAWTYAGGIRGSYAFSPVVGLSAVTEVTLGDPLFGDDEVKAPVLMGAACDVDFLPMSGTPIGLVGSLVYRTDSNAGDDVANSSVTGGLGVFYTGRKEYAVGMEFNFQSVEQLSTDENINVVQARLITRYDF